MLFGLTIVPSLILPVPFVFLNQGPLNKQRRYLDQSSIKEGLKLYHATKIMNFLCVGTYGAMDVVAILNEANGYNSNGPLVIATSLLGATEVTTIVLHWVCYVRQKSRLQAFVNGNHQQHSQSGDPIVVPYVSFGENKKTFAGLALRF